MSTKTRGIVFEAQTSRDVMPSTTTLLDKSRWKNNGTWTNGAYTRLPSGLWVGNFNSATPVTISCGNDASFNSQILSFACWFNTNSVDASRIVGHYPRYFFSSRNDYITMWIYWSDLTDTGTVTILNPISLNTWYHFGIVINSSGGNTSVAAYLNGGEDTYINNYAKTLRSATTPSWSIGHMQGFSSNQFNGYLSYQKLFNYPLTPGQILKIYESERHLFGV